MFQRVSHNVKIDLSKKLEIVNDMILFKKKIYILCFIGFRSFENSWSGPR